MQLLIERGCRSALPGEYTQRAFMNGKMDLSQAEAVADLIASTSAGQHRLALNQMRGIKELARTTFAYHFFDGTGTGFQRPRGVGVRRP